jgi:hypothetical protein
VCEFRIPCFHYYIFLQNRMRSVWIILNANLNCLILSVRLLIWGGILLHIFIQQSRFLFDIIINLLEVGKKWNICTVIVSSNLVRDLLLHKENKLYIVILFFLFFFWRYNHWLFLASSCALTEGIKFLRSEILVTFYRKVQFPFGNNSNCVLSILNSGSLRTNATLRHVRVTTVVLVKQFVL